MASLPLTQAGNARPCVVKCTMDYLWPSPGGLASSREILTNQGSFGRISNCSICGSRIRLNQNEETAYRSILHRIDRRQLFRSSTARSSRTHYGEILSWVARGRGINSGGLHTSCTGASFMVLHFHRPFGSGLCGFMHSTSVRCAIGALASGRLNP